MRQESELVVKCNIETVDQLIIDLVCAVECLLECKTRAYTLQTDVILLAYHNTDAAVLLIHICMGQGGGGKFGADIVSLDISLSLLSAERGEVGEFPSALIVERASDLFYDRLGSRLVKS